MDELATPQDVVDYLTYSSYAHQRDTSPNVTPERWASIFGAKAVERMEPIYIASKVSAVEAALAKARRTA